MAALHRRPERALARGRARVHRARAGGELREARVRALGRHPERDSLPYADLGFAFLARHRGHGYAREAAAATVALAHERFGLTRLLAITDPDNTASRAVLEHVGFAFEREFTWSENGQQQALYAKDLA